jgi:DNA-binding Xre family transcriptional regulator
MITPTYSTQLKKQLKEVGYKNIPHLAGDVGIHPNTLYSFGRGEANLPIKSLLKLLYLLHCTFEELVSYEIDDTTDDGLELSDKVVESMKEADDEYQAWLKAKANGMVAIYNDDGNIIGFTNPEPEIAYITKEANNRNHTT